MESGTGAARLQRNEDVSCKSRQTKKGLMVSGKNQCAAKK